MRGKTAQNFCNQSTETLTYNYNAMGALLNLTGTNTYVSQINYSASGQVEDQLLGNGLLQQSCYNATTLRLTNLRTYPGTIQSCVVTNPANARLNLSYQYQNNGNVSQIVDATRNETLNYTYDELDRLDTVSGQYPQNYNYNEIGNITSKTGSSNPGTSSLAAWWKLNETSGTRNDSHGTNHLTDNNTVASAAGKVGNAASFVSTNSEYLSIPDNVALSMGDLDFTICTWTYLTSKTAERPLLSKWDAPTNNREYMLSYSAVADRFTFIVSSDGISSSFGTVRADNFGSPALNTWYFVCVWHDALGNTINIQVNNGTANSAALSTGVYNGAASLDLGRRRLIPSPTAVYMDGRLDETVIYKRLLTDNERGWLYDGGSGQTYGDLGSGTTYTYNASHKHAVASLSTGETYTYDANGNMITRVEGGLTYTQTFNAENRLISVTVSGQTTQFIYDGDGNLVKKIKPDGSRTIYVGGIYEVDKASGGSIQRTVTYYPVAGAMRINSTLYYTLKDHLGSASVVTDASGNILGENRYYPFGETRLSTGSILTDKLFTSQREMAGLGIYHYGARFYSPKLGRFLSPDTIVPGYANPQAYNRYSYVLNNPIRYNDPTGHVCSDPDDPTPSCESGNPYPNNTNPLPSGPVNIPGGPLDPGLPQGGGGNGGNGGGGTTPTPTPTPSDEVGDSVNSENSITFTYDTQYHINNYFPYSMFTADQWGTASLWLDYLALGIDTFAGMIVLGHVAVGLAGGPGGAGGGYLAGEFNPIVRGLVTAGNVAASGATFMGVVASAKSGDLRYTASVKITQSQVSLTTSASMPVSLIASGALTGAGWAAQPVSLSLPIQMTTVLNDHGVFNFPTLKFNTSMSFP